MLKFRQHHKHRIQSGIGKMRQTTSQGWTKEKLNWQTHIDFVSVVSGGAGLFVVGAQGQVVDAGALSNVHALRSRSKSTRTYTHVCPYPHAHTHTHKNRFQKRTSQ